MHRPLKSTIGARRGWLLTVVLGASLLVATAARAFQDGAQQEQQAADAPGDPQPQAEVELVPQEPPGVPTGEDVAQGVFVRDSAVAVDQFVLAERLERLRDWTKAADVYQDVTVRFGELLIADRSDAEGRIVQYASVARAVQRKLSAWPPEGREVYEQKFGAAARTLLDQARQQQPADLEQLQRIVQLYFITEAGREASLLLIDRHLSDGSFAAARRLSRELLEMHPGLAEARPAVLLRALAAAHFLGDDEQARLHQQEIQEQFPQATAAIAGEQRSVREAAEQVLATALPSGTQMAAGTWPTFGGSDDRSRLPPPLSSQIAPYVQDLRVPETSIDGRALGAPQRREMENARQSGQATGIFPVAYDGALYWSDNIHIYAVGLDSGLPLPGWLDTYGAGAGDAPAGYTLPGGGYVTPRGVALTPVVTDRLVVANMGLRDDRLYSGGGNPTVAASAMVCLDRRTGRPMWKRSPSELEATSLADATLQADFGECEFVGTPLVVGDAVWSLAKTDTRRRRQFEQSFLVSLDLETGKTRTITYLASSSGSDPAMRYGQRTFVPEPNSLIAYADGLIYAPTDTGALAAVRASDGAVEWLNLYPRNETDLRERLGLQRVRVRTQTESQPFHAAPVIVEGGRVFFKPPDARHVFVWSASDGEEVARVDLGATERVGATDQVRSVDGDRSLVKVMGDQILTFGSKGVSCIDWTRVRAGDSPLQATRWSHRVDAAEGDDGIMGRPAVTQTQLLVPTMQHLRVIQVSDGRFVATYPTGGAPWAQEEEPGNVVVLEDQLVVAGPSRLNVYADSAVIRERLREQVARNPDDPTPLLRLAQIAFVSGEFDDTIQHLRQAEQASLAARDAASADIVMAQGSVFASALGFAQTLSERLGNALAPGSPTPETVDRFFSAAEKFARTPAQNVRVRFARAAFEETEGGAQRRVALLQEILSDAAWRQVPVVPENRDAAMIAGDSFSPRQAGEVARELLQQLIERSGPGVYEEVERRAAAELADAVAASDAEALQRLAEIYPNSAAAAEALGEAARLLEAQNRLREAASALRRLAARSEDPTEVWLRLAALDVRREERLLVAAGRLRKTARTAPDAPAPPMALPDGTQLNGLTAEQAAFRLTEAAVAADAQRVPDLALPDDPMQAMFAAEPSAIAGIEALLVPEEGFERWDRLIVRRSDGTLAAYAAAETEPLWTTSAGQGEADAVAWLPEGLLVWGPSGVALRDPETGEPRWRHTASALGPGQLLAGAGSARPVVASGWRPRASELQAEVIRPVEIQPDWQRGRAAFRREEQLRQLERLERVEQARRENLAAGEPQDGVPSVEIVTVRPLPGTITVMLGGAGNGVTGLVPEDGSILWRASLPEGELSAAHGDGDYLAVQTDASRSVLSVLDLDTGALVTRRGFDLQGEPLCAFLVTPENELLLATPRLLTGLDLEGDLQRARFTIRAEEIGQNPAAFRAAAGVPGRMKVMGAKLLIMADPYGYRRRDAIVVDLERGRPETSAEPIEDARPTLVLTAAESFLDEFDADELPPRLRAQRRGGGRDRGPLQEMPAERIWTAGASLYLTADRGMSAYDLSVPGRHWHRLNAPMMREFDPAVNQQVIIGRDELLLIDQPLPTPRRQVEQGTLRVTSFSRDRLPDGRESGQQRHEVELVTGTLSLDAPVQSLQALDGGLAVLTGSGRLVLLRSGPAR